MLNDVISARIGSVALLFMARLFTDKSLYGIQPPRGQPTDQELSWLEALVKFCRLIRLIQYERAV